MTLLVIRRTAVCLDAAAGTVASLETAILLGSSGHSYDGVWPTVATGMTRQ